MSSPILVRDFRGLDLAAVQAFAAELMGLLTGPGTPSTVTVGLVGELGAGKTTFAQAAVAALKGGAKLPVTSPTYAIMQVYETEPPVRHVDLYRIASVEELEVIGYDELSSLPGVNLVEWFRQIPEAIPPERIEIELAAGLDDVRDIRVRACGAALIPLLEKVPER